MLACNDGEHAERADCNEYCFFEVADASRAKAEKLKVTFSEPAERKKLEDALYSHFMGKGFFVAPVPEPTSQLIDWERLDRDWKRSQKSEGQD